MCRFVAGQQAARGTPRRHRRRRDLDWATYSPPERARARRRLRRRPRPRRSRPFQTESLLVRPGTSPSSDASSSQAPTTRRPVLVRERASARAPARSGGRKLQALAVAHRSGDRQTTRILAARRRAMALVVRPGRRHRSRRAGTTSRDSRSIDSSAVSTDIPLQNGLKMK
jgi:hypothetical protein